jgi:hypothetical protein
LKLSGQRTHKEKDTSAQNTTLQPYGTSHSQEHMTENFPRAERKLKAQGMQVLLLISSLGFKF